MSVQRGRRLVLAFALGALCLKMVVVFWTGGTNDIAHWSAFSYLAGKYGPVDMYAHTAPGSYYNHPPLMGYVLELVNFNRQHGIPVKVSIRTAASVGDAVSALLVYELIRRRRSVIDATACGVAVALSPVLFTVSAYHGNTDPIFTMLVFLSVYLLAYRLAPVWAGVVIAIGIGVKLPAIVALPCLFIYAWSQHRRTLARFCLGFVSVFAATWGPALILQWSQVKSHVLQYTGSGPRPWGLMQFARWSQSPAWFNWMAGPGHLPIVAFCAVLPAFAVWRRPSTVVPAVALAQCLFMALSPAFAIQYLAWPALATIVISFWRGLIYNIAAGALLIHEYTRWAGQFPWPRRIVTYLPSTAGETVFLVLVWAILLGACWQAIREVASGGPPQFLRQPSDQPRRDATDRSPIDSAGPVKAVA